MSYEKLMEEYPHLTIKEVADLPKGLGGLYYDNVILLDKHRTEREKACLLTEELGHYHTTAGNIINQNNIQNVKQEKQARKWAWNKLVTPIKLVDAFNEGSRSKYEIAEYLNITEQFLEEGLKFYREKYGTEIKVNEEYTLFLEPLAVYKSFI